MKKLSFIISVFVLIALSHISVAQDFGTVDDDASSDAVEDATPLDPYKLTLRVRPFAYLLFPLTSGKVAIFNGKIDYAFTRHISAGIDINYFYQRPWAQASLATRLDFFSVRLDGNYYFHNNLNGNYYAEGFHIGPYLNYIYQEQFDPNGIPDLGTNLLRSHNAVFGGLIGFQYVKNSFLIDPHMGLGLGLGLANIGIIPALDFRIGVSIGTVLLR